MFNFITPRGGRKEATQTQEPTIIALSEGNVQTSSSTSLDTTLDYELSDINEVKLNEGADSEEHMARVSSEYVLKSWIFI